MRNGAFSSFDPRSSTNGVLLGTGRAMRARIHAGAGAAATAAPSGRGPGAAGTAVAATVIAGTVIAGTVIARASIAATRCLVFAARRMGVPIVIEVEPVVGEATAQILEPRRVTPDERRHVSATLRPRHGLAVAERLEAQIVPVAAPIEPERQHHRRPEHGRHLPGRQRERRRRA